MKNLLLSISLLLLTLVISCKKDEDSAPIVPTEPQSEEITSLANTDWLRPSDGMESHFESDSLYLVNDSVTYIHTYSYSDYKITYQWIASEVNGVRVPPQFDNPVRVAKVKLLKNELYFWTKFETEPWGKDGTYLLGIKSQQ